MVITRCIEGVVRRWGLKCLHPSRVHDRQVPLTAFKDSSNYGTSTNYQAALFTETRLRPLGQQMPADRRETQLDRTAAYLGCQLQITHTQ